MTTALILTLEEVSRLLSCSTDTLRRIPLDDLPRYKVGKCHLFLLEDVIRFLRNHRRVGCQPGIDALLSKTVADVLESASDGVRKRAQETSTT